MAITNQISNKLKSKQPKFSVALKSEAYQNLINTSFRDPKRANRFIANIMSAVSTNPDLEECEHRSILSAGILGETLNLTPSPQLGQFYIIPFEIKGRGKVATFQLGYKGYIQLAIRSGYYKKLNVVALKQGELIKYDPVNEDAEIKLIEGEEREKKPVAGYFAMFEYTNGFRKTLYWSKWKMEQHALKYSPGYRADKNKGTAYTFWAKDFDGMAYKTMLRQLISKWGIMSVDMQEGFSKDYSLINEDGTTEYVEENIDITPEIQPTDNVLEEAKEEIIKEPKKQEFFDDSKLTINY